MSARKTPQWFVEQLASGALPPGRAEQIRARLQAEEDGLARLAEAQRAQQQVLEQYPPRVGAAHLRERLARGRTTGRWLPVLAAASLAAVIVGRRWGIHSVPAAAIPASADATSGTTRSKGGMPKLFVHRDTGTTPETLANGATVHARDVLQLSYRAAGHPYGAIVSIDGAGGVTLHSPARAEEPARLKPSGEVALDAAYELDAAPGFERFFLVASDDPVDLAQILAAARALAADPARAGSAPLSLPAQLEQASVLLPKVNR